MTGDGKAAMRGVTESAGWPLTELGAVCRDDVQNRDPRRRPDEPFSYIDITSVDNRAKRIVGPKSLLGKDAPSRARQIVRSGDVLVATTRPNLNAVALVPPELDGQVCSTGFCVLRSSERLDSGFLFAFVQSREFVESLSELVKGALYPAVTDEQVRSQLIPLPSFAEQVRVARKLADQLASVERARSAAGGQSAAVRQLSSTYVDLAFKSPSSGAWPMLRLGDASEIVSGIQKSPSRNPTAHHRPYLTVRNVQRGSLDLSNVERFEVSEYEVARLRLEVGDLLIVEGNGSLEHIGRNALFGGQLTDCIHQNHIIRCRLSPSLLRPAFVSLYLNSDAGRTQMVDKARTSSGLYTLSAGKVSSLEIPVPPFAEQLSIENMIAETRSSIERLESAIATARDAIDQLSAAFLRRAFNGEL